MLRIIRRHAIYIIPLYCIMDKSCDLKLIHVTQTKPLLIKGYFSLKQF